MLLISGNVLLSDHFVPLVRSLCDEWRIELLRDSNVTPEEVANANRLLAEFDQPVWRKES